MLGQVLKFELRDGALWLAVDGPIVGTVTDEGDNLVTIRTDCGSVLALPYSMLPADDVAPAVPPIPEPVE